MALHKLTLRPGIVKDATATAGKGGWFDADKVRFRNGFPEKIGGWAPAFTTRVQGTARALLTWVTLDGRNMLGIGTNIKYYTEVGGTVTDITPVRKSVSDTDIITVTTGSTTVRVSVAQHGAGGGDYFEVTGATDVGGIPADEINGEHIITATGAGYVEFAVATPATSDVTGGGAVTVDFQIPTGLETYVAGIGWGADGWGVNGWGSAGHTGVGRQLTLWNHANYGQTLIYGVRGGAIYKYDPTDDIGGRGSHVTGTEVPLTQDVMIVSDISRFVLVGGTNDVLSTTYDPLLVRWSDQEDYTQWSPSVTNQAGSWRLSQGSYIVSAVQMQQEVLIWTDNALYSAQYVGTPWVWAFELRTNNISIMSPNAAVSVNNMVFWMGVDKFYVYSGRVDTLPCTISSFIFTALNLDQSWQVFSGTNERFNEVWWFYCSENSIVVDRYVIFNYVENTWSHGTMGRTSWIEGTGRKYPLSSTQDGLIVYHEFGNDDGAVNPVQPIYAHIQSSDIDIDDGDKMSFVWRMIPDLAFDGSTTPNPIVDFGLAPRKNPGADYMQEPMLGVQRMKTTPVETFTEYVYTRVRGRQIALRVSSDTMGTHWRLGTPRVDVQPDGGKN